MSKTTLFRVLAISVVFSALFVAGSFIPPTQSANAADILNKALQRPTGLLINDDSYVRYQREIYRRMSPALLRPDPYHKELSPTKIEINWVTGLTNERVRFEQRDGATGELLAEVRYDNQRMWTRDYLYGIETLVDIKPPSTSGASVPQTELQPLAEIASSVWGRPAWVVTQTRPVVNSPVQRTEARMIEIPDVQRLERTWIVDKATNLVVQSEEYAITTSGARELIERVRLDVPVMGKLNELPSNWFEIPQKRTLPNQPAVLPSSGPNFTVGQPLGTIGRQYLLLSEPGALGLTLDHVVNGLSIQPTIPIAQVPDIQRAASYGHALELVYRSEDGTSYFGLIQGPREPLVKLMQSKPANYLSSKAVTASIGTKQVTAWLAEGGNFSHQPEHRDLMFEFNDLFVYVVGQNASEEHLLKFVASLVAFASPQPQ